MHIGILKYPERHDSILLIKTAFGKVVYLSQRFKRLLSPCDY